MSLARLSLSLLGFLLLWGCADVEGVSFDPSDPAQVEKYCGKGMLFCDNLCTKSSVENCGFCGVKCGEFVCVNNRCECPEGLDFCSSGCVNLQTSVSHCGDCDISCEQKGGVKGASCEQGRCVFECEPGFADCDKDWQNGCEVEILSSSVHCGACLSEGGISCVTGTSCNQGKCDECEDGFVKIVAASFRMGSPSGEFSRASNESPHQVTLTRSYCAQKYEVGARDFYQVMAYWPGQPTIAENLPASSVNWHEAANYASSLSVLKNHEACYNCSGQGREVECVPVENFYDCKGYRLPTEAEWEFFARAGSSGTYYNGNATDHAAASGLVSEIAWYGENSENKAHVLGQKIANMWGGFDLSGNVAEWCHDEYVENLGTADVTDPIKAPASLVSERVFRGGGYASSAADCRMAKRSKLTAKNRSSVLGFRLVRGL